MNTLAATEKGPDLARGAARLLTFGTISAHEAGVDWVGSTLVQQLSGVLAPLAPGGAWPGRNTTEPMVFPYITFFRVISSANISFDGPSDVQSTRIQIDCFGTRYADADALMRSITAAILLRFNVGAIDSQDFPPDPDVYAYRISSDFTLWSPDS